MKTISYYLSIAYCFLLLVSNQAIAQSTDYRAQVLLMYNFIKYINWPTSDENFTIGVVGSSPITDELKKLASIKKTPEGKTIIIKQLIDLRDSRFCQMIYVIDSRSKDITALLEQLKNTSTLLIAERDGMAKKGAEINFFIQDDDKLGFSVSRKNIDIKKLKISGELLRLAELAD